MNKKLIAGSLISRAPSGERHPPVRGETGEAPRAVKTGCRKSIYFNGSGRMDAARGESRQGGRVSPCPLKSMLFQEAAGHPVRRVGFHRFPLGMLSKIKSIRHETGAGC